MAAPSAGVSRYPIDVSQKTRLQQTSMDCGSSRDGSILFTANPDYMVSSLAYSSVSPLACRPDVAYARFHIKHPSLRAVGENLVLPAEVLGSFLYKHS